MTLHQVNFPRSADDITLRNVITHGLWMQGPSNISIIGGEITCGACGYHSHLQNGGSDNAAPRNILFDGVNFHDWHSISGEHVECLQILGADGVTIRNSIFKNCGTGSGGLGATADLHIAWTGVGAMTQNILLENNFFYASGNPYTIQMDDYANIDSPQQLHRRPNSDVRQVGSRARGSTSSATSSAPATAPPKGSRSTGATTSSRAALAAQPTKTPPPASSTSTTTSTSQPAPQPSTPATPPTTPTTTSTAKPAPPAPHPTPAPTKPAEPNPRRPEPPIGRRARRCAPASPRGSAHRAARPDTARGRRRATERHSSAPQADCRLRAPPPTQHRRRRR